MKGLIAIKNSLIKTIKNLDEQNLKKNNLLEEQEELKQKIPQKEAELKYEIETKNRNCEQQITQTKQQAFLELSSVTNDAELAKAIAEQQEREFEEEWEKQQQALANLRNQIDHSEDAKFPPRLLSLPWDDPRWTPSESDPNNYKPQLEGLAPAILRIGELLVEQVNPITRFPALVPIRALSHSSGNYKPGHLAIFSSDAESRQAAVSAIESIALRVISTFPMKKLKGTFIDPVSMGNSFPFGKLDNFISGQKTYTRSDDVREQLRGLTNHIEQVIQNYLGRNYETIEDYNIDAKAVAVPYHYLFIADFPTAFDNNSWEDLKSILSNGTRAGVYVILHIDETLEKPKNFDYSLLDNYCTVLRPSFGLNVGAKPQVGNVYLGYVTNLVENGAYVEFLPGVEGFVPANKLIEARVERVEDAAYHNEQKIVKVRSINSQGEIELTCLDIHPDEKFAAQQKDFRSAQYRNQTLKETLFEMRSPNENDDLTYKVILDEPPPSDQFNQIIELVNEKIKQVKVETISFEELYPQKINPGKAEWSEYYDSRQEIRTPIGLMGAMDKLEFWLGENDDGLAANQALLAGKPNAGKSYTLHAIIISLAMRYAPDELEMYLLDFKEGVEFQIYVDPERAENESLTEELNESKALPHAKVVSIESDREFGLSVLKSIQEEIQKRGNKFKKAGVSSIKEYRNKTNEKMPRILIVIDEFQYMFQESDPITRQLNTIFEDITRRGRAFGVHLLIATQSPNVPNMSSRIYSFIELRMAQQMDKSTAASILAEGNTDAVDLLDRPGKVIYNKDFGRKHHNDIGQVADVSLKARIDALLNIQSIAQVNGYQRTEPLILFNGSRPTKLKHNRQLVQLSQISQWLSLKELNQQVLSEKDWIVQETPGVAWLGEAMQIGNHTKAIFRRRPRSNMLLVGASEETIFGIISGILISLIHCYLPQKAQFNIIDLSYEDNSWEQLSVTFRNAFEDYFPTIVAKRFPDPDNKIQRAENLLQKTCEELESRQKKREENPDELNLGQSLFFIYAIGSLSRAQNLRPVTDPRDREELSEDAKKLQKLIAQGSELGIHTILWIDDMKTLGELILDKYNSWVTNFDFKVSLTLPKEDSQKLFKESDAQNLPPLRAFFYDNAKASGLEKFKPYAVPTAKEIAEYSNKFKHRYYIKQED